MTLRDWAQAILLHLPGCWGILDGQCYGGGRMQLWRVSDGLRLLLSLSEGRVRISPLWPKSKYDNSEFPSAANRPDSITVSFTRPPADSAVDIKRRLLEEAVEAHLLGCHERDNYDREIDAQHALKKELLGLLGQVCSDEIARYGCGSFRAFLGAVGSAPYINGQIHSSSSIRLELDYLTPELARQVIALVKEATHQAEEPVLACKDDRDTVHP